MKIDYGYEDWTDKTCRTLIIHHCTIIEPHTDIIEQIKQNFNINLDIIDRIWFEHSNIDYFPGGLSGFHNLTHVMINGCGLKHITKEDLKGLKHLKDLHLPGNEIESLPSDLFEYTGDLEVIDLDSNKIVTINSNILDPLKRLKVFNLRCNPNIDYNYVSTDKKTCLCEFKKMIAKCKIHNEKDLTLQEDCSILWNAIKAVLDDDDLKDFTIKVGGEVFKTHKIILAARSPVFAEMIKNNSDAKELDLIDIKPCSFKIILDFLYTNKMPEGDIDWIAIFSASGRLGLNNLKKFAQENLILELNSENAFRILLAASKFNSVDLKNAAFEELQKMFPDKDLNPTWADRPEKIQKLIEAKKKFDEEFESLKI